MLGIPITKLKTSMRALLFVLTIILFSAAPYALAQSSSQDKKLETLSQTLKQEKDKKRELDKQARDIQKTLKDARYNLVKLTKSIAANEQKLERLKDDILRQEQEQTAMLDALTEDQKAISKLIMGLERMRRMPPEAMFIKPDAPYKTAQSAMLLQKILPTIHAQAADLRQSLQALEEKTNALQADRDEALQSSKMLEEKERKLESLLKERETIYSKTHQSLKKTNINISKISKESRDLKQLLANLKAEEQRQAVATNKVSRRTPLPKAGKPSLPARGTIITAYRELDAFGAKSQGLTLKAKSGAIVTAPMGGIVRFAGAFKNYGQMVIIEHKGDYHSLIGGLKKINVNVNQSVLSGEPIGKLSKDAGSSHHVYFELRHKGKAINPKKRIAGL